MKTVENDADRCVIGAPHDLPGVAVVVDVTSPGEPLIADAQAPRAGPFAQLAKIGRRTIDAAERSWRDVAADQHQIGLQFLHQVELALGADEVSRPLWLRHALEITEWLERADRKPEIPAHLADVARAAAERQQIVLENLDGVEAGRGDRAQLFVERAAERNRGDRALVHAACSMIRPGDTRAPVRAASRTASTTASVPMASSTEISGISLLAMTARKCRSCSTSGSAEGTSTRLRESGAYQPPSPGYDHSSIVGTDSDPLVPANR